MAINASARILDVLCQVIQHETPDEVQAARLEMERARMRAEDSNTLLYDNMINSDATIMMLYGEIRKDRAMQVLEKMVERSYMRM